MLTIGHILRLTLIVGAILTIVTWIDCTSVLRLVPTRQYISLRAVKPLKIFLSVLLGTMGLCYAVLGWLNHKSLHGTGLPIFPYLTPYIQFMNFLDLNAYALRMSFLRSPSFWDPSVALIPWQYPPAMTLVYAALCVEGQQNYIFMLAFTLLTAVPALLLARRLAQHGLQPHIAYGFVVLTLLFSYPLWMEASLGNMEFFCAAMVGAGVTCYMRRQLSAAAILFGLAASIKIFPFVYFGLFLCRRQYKRIAIGVVTVVVANLAGLWLMAPDMKHSWHEIQIGFAINRLHYMQTRLIVETGIDHSGFGLVKQVFYNVRHTPFISPRLLTAYMAMVIILGLALYFLRIVHLPLLNQIAALCVVSILLPPTSHDYTLLHLYVPWAVFVVVAVRSAALGKKLPGMTAIMTCFALLFASESEIIYNGASYGGQFKCLTLVVLLTLVLRYPMSTDLLEEQKSPELGGSFHAQRLQETLDA